MLPFQPQELPLDQLDWKRLSKCIGEASKYLSEYNGLLRAIPNPNVLLSPLTNQEAVLSSKIEGTQASLIDVLQYEADENPSSDEQYHDIIEVINYRRALLNAETLLKKMPVIHLNMLKELHKILLNGARGKNKARGEFRSIQNFIGPYGCTIETATFVPPAPQNVIPALSNWEKYINSEDDEILVQLAVMHAQFEIIHPFLDGNGRMGRMLIPLFLYQKEYLQKPVFYLSEYFEKNREEYYARLSAITTIGDWQGWIEFFLKAVCEQSKINTEKAQCIVMLYQSMSTKFVELTGSKYAPKILDKLFMKPIITTSELFKAVGIKTKVTGGTIISKLAQAKLIKVKKYTGPRPSMCYFSDLLKIADTHYN